MRTWGVLVSVVVLGASACHSVFSLTPPPDAAPLECMRDPFDGGPDEDDDADEIVNSEDSCPKTPGIPHNEDADCRGDDCDPCPHRPEPTADMDGDGVGDVCDPSPARHHVVFDAFLTDADMRPQAGSWDGQSGDRYAALMPEFSVSLRSASTVQNGSYETAFALPDDAIFDAGIAFGLAELRRDADGYVAAVSRTDAGYQLRLYFKVGGAIATPPYATQDIAELQPRATYALDVTVDVNDVVIRLRGNGSEEALATTLSAPLPTTSYYGLVATVPCAFAYLARVAPL